MKSPRASWPHIAWMSVLAGLMVFTRSLAIADLPPLYEPTNGEFNAISKAVVELIKTRAAGTFATNYSAGPNDWQSLITTNLPASLVERIQTFAKGSDSNKDQLNQDAQAMLDRADLLHVNLSNSVLNDQVTAPKSAGWIYLSEGASDPMTLPYINRLEIVLTRPSKTPPGTDKFKIIVQGLEKFPTGWRIAEGMQWSAIPTNLADPDVRRELSLLNKVATFQHINSQDDPALLKFGQSLVHFIQHPDPAAYEKDLLMNSDTLWAMYQKSGRPGPSRKEVDDEVERRNLDQVAVAGKMIRVMSDNGIVLSNADIRIVDASLDHCQPGGAPGSMDPLMGSDFLLKFSVQTSATAANGASLSGEYCLGAQEIMKFGPDWKVSQDIHWEKLPDGVLDSNTVAAMDLENYVAKYRALPAGSAAPEIHFTSLEGDKLMKLSDLRGKVVVLDFWATWCGPCQKPMADLQTLRHTHPDWKDRVAIIPVSIDDTADIVRHHVNQRGWTNTFNVWAGKGGWDSTTAQTFRVTAVPTSYVLDPRGKIVWSGHPFEDIIAHEVTNALNQTDGNSPAPNDGL